MICVPCLVHDVPGAPVPFSPGFFCSSSATWCFLELASRLAQARLFLLRHCVLPAIEAETVSCGSADGVSNGFNRQRGGILRQGVARPGQSHMCCPLPEAVYHYSIGVHMAIRNVPPQQRCVGAAVSLRALREPSRACLHRPFLQVLRRAPRAGARLVGKVPATRE